MAYPYPSPAARKEMRNVLIERALKNGFSREEIEKNINVHDLISGQQERGD